MTTFSDNFNRANGLLGSGWIPSDSAIRIDSNVAYIASGGWALAAQTFPGAYVSASAKAASGNGQGWGLYLIIKATSGLTEYLSCVLSSRTGGGTFSLVQFVEPTTTVLATIDVPTWTPGAQLLTITYDSGVVTATVNGGYTLTASPTISGANAYVGFWQARGDIVCDDFTATDDAPQSMDVTPNPLWAGGGSQLMVATGTSVAWTVGIPGSSTITANHGTVEMQACTSGTTIQFLYTPADYIGPIIFTESQYGLTDTINAQATVPSGYGPLGGTLLSPQVLTWLENQAAHGGLVLADNDTLTADTSGNAIKVALGEVLLGTRQAVGDANTTLSNPALLALLWRLMNGGSQPVVGPFPAPSFNTLDQGLGQIDGKIDTLVGEAGWTLAELLFSLGGNPVVSTSDLADQITALDMTGGTAILSAISTLRGSDTATVAALASSLSSLRTADGYSLASVKGWIDSLPDAAAGPSAVAVVALIAALALAIPTGGASIAAEAVAVGAGPLLDIATLVEVVSVLGELAGIASSVASIRDSLSAPVSVRAPVWPGEGKVTLGTLLDLTDDLVIEGPMHGLLFTITDQPVQPHKYMFGSVASWSRVGAVLFCTDRGDYERSQTFSVDSQIMTPQTMAEAASAVIRLNAGWNGTVRSWKAT